MTSTTPQTTKSGSRSIVLIPCFDRPEFLAICLEIIQQAELCDQFDYLFQVDFDFDPEILNVIGDFQLRKYIRFTPEHPFPNKQSYSVFCGYQNAAEMSPKYIFNIETDVMIANDFFIFHLSIIDEHWASVATINHNIQGGVKTKSNLLNNYYSCSEYQSLGVCFHLSSVIEFLKEPDLEYWINPVSWIKRRFPNSRINPVFAEQDGLIRRLIQQNLYQVGFPSVPRAFHAGYYGKSRGQALKGSLESRIDQVRNTIFDIEKMSGDCAPELLVNPVPYLKLSKI